MPPSPGERGETSKFNSVIPHFKSCYFKFSESIYELGKIPNGKGINSEKFGSQLRHGEDYDVDKDRYKGRIDKNSGSIRKSNNLAPL